MSIRPSIASLAMATLAGFGGGVLSQHLIGPAQAAGNASVVTARDFRVVDANGKVVAELGPIKFSAKSATETALRISGPNRLQTSLATDGLYFGRGYGDEDLGVGYAYGSSHKLGAAIFFWYQKRGRMGLMLDADKAGAPSAWMYDGSGKTLWSAPAPTPTP